MSKSWINSLSVVMSDYSQKLGNYLVFFLSRHWLSLMNLFFLSIILGNLLAPYLAHLNLPRESRIIYTIYHLACHQKENRSFFIFDHKMGVCARCFSIYASLFILGLVYSIFARFKVRIVPLKFKFAFLSVIPLTIDGLSQALTSRQSSNFLRMATGIVFSLGCVFFFYPRLDQELREVKLGS